MASLLDQGIAGTPEVQGFPAEDKDIKALFKIAMDAVHNPKVRDLLVKQLEQRPDRAPDIVAQLAAMLSWRIIAQVKEQMNVDLPKKNAVGLLMVLVTELFTLVESLGGAPVDKQTIQGTVKLALNQLDQIAEGQQNGRQ